jgi:cytochrome P450
MAHVIQPLLYDPEDPGYRSDPYPLYARLRTTEPVHRSPLGYWVLSRYADIDRVHRDPRCVRGLQPGDGMVAAWGGWSSPIAAELGSWMLLRDGVDHARFRRTVGKAFHPAAIRSLRTRIRGIVDALLDQAASRGAMDVIGDLALPLPVAVIGELLGLPAADPVAIGRWARAIGRAFDEVLTSQALDEAEHAIRNLTAHLKERLEQSASPIVAALRGPAPDGEAGLSEQELISNLNLLFFAGFETTRNLIGNGFLALLGHPDQLARLRAEPSLVGNAVLELLRYDSPVQANRRVTVEPIEIGGIRIGAGEKLLLLLGAANRDPERFADPDALDVARRDVRPLSFGGGVHYCLGAPLAELEAEIALSTLVRRLDGVERAPGPVDWSDSVFLRGLKALPITFTP